MSTRDGRPDDDFDEEIRSHLEHEVDELVADGADPAEARFAARKQFGNAALAGERYYEAGRRLWLDRARQDLIDASRSLLRYPVSSAIGVLSIAAGIGVMAATLTIRDVVFRNPPPEYARPEQLSEVLVARGTQRINPIGSNAPGGLFERWRDALGPAAIAAVQPPSGVRDVRAGEHFDSVPVRGATAELFDLLGVRPLVGRTFADAAAADTAPPAILSYRLWQQWFDGRTDAVGRTISIENRPHTVIGVLPRRFWVSAFQPAVWTRLDRAATEALDRVEVFARRPPATGPDALLHTLEPVMASYAAQQPADRRQFRMAVVPVIGTPAGKQMSIALPYVLGTASLLTLLIACANVAILMIARWTAREHEISIRASLGASRGRLVRALLTESTLVAACGGTLGVGTGYVLLKVMLARTDPPEFVDLSIHPGVFLGAAAATLLAGLMIGLAPALVETRRLHGNPMRTNAHAEPLRQRWRHALVVLEISVTVALLVVASTFINSFRRVTSANMGFDTRPMLSTNVEHPAGVPIDAVLGAIRGVAGVADAAASTTVPFTTNAPRTRVALDRAGSNAVSAERATISPSFFTTLDVAIRQGRPFVATDAANGHVAIVNEALARRLFGESGVDHAVGGRIWFDDAVYDVVGVAANFANRSFFIDYEPRVFVAQALTSKGLTRATFVVRARDDPAPLVPVVRRAIRDGAPGAVVTSAYTFEAIKVVSSEEIILGTAPLVPLIVIGLLLTAAGIYGVLAFAIERRQRELAIRLAVGATGGHLAGLVAGHCTRLVAAGVAVGVGFTFALSRIVRANSGGGSPFDSDWTAFVAPVVIISMIAALATWIPSRRVRTIDPAVLLRSET